MAMLSRSKLSQPVPSSSLDLFQVGFGLILAWYFIKSMYSGLLALQYIRPKFFFTYPGFDWVSPWSGTGMYWHYSALALLALLLALGIGYRIVTVLLFLGFGYVFLLDMSRYQNHLYLTLLLCGILMCLPRPTALWTRWKTQGKTISFTPRWCLYLLRFQLGLVYFFGGIAKLNGDWLLRAQPMTAWLSRDATGYITGTPLAHPWAAFGLSWGGTLFDLAIVPALLWRRTRPFAFALVAIFHLANAYLFHIGFFPWLMLWATLLFFPPDWPRQFAAWLRSLFGPRSAPSAEAVGSTEIQPLAKLTWCCLLLFGLIQFLLPLRHWAYPGNVSWTEEGHRFAWRMKLREKVGTLKFFWIQRDREQISPLYPETILDRRQISKMIHDPHLIKQFCQAIAEGLARKGQSDIDLKVISEISLNGRPAQPIIDPTINMAQVPPGPGMGHWILPLKPLGKQNSEGHSGAE